MAVIGRYRSLGVELTFIFSDYQTSSMAKEPYDITSNCLISCPSIRPVKVLVGTRMKGTSAEKKLKLIKRLTS